MSERATTYAELKEAISRAFPALSPQLQRLSRFAMDKPHDLALGTVAAIAQANGVQPSSLIRFANALGFSGFSQMQQVFQSHLVERSAPHAAPYRERIAQMKRGSAGGKVAESPLHRFVADPQDFTEVLRRRPELIPMAVEESLRFEPPVLFLFRTAKTETASAGCPVHRGDRVLVGIASANRDEHVYEHADEFRLDRARLPDDHLSFGAGPHLCLGNHLTRLIGRVVLEEMLAVFGPGSLAFAEGYERCLVPMFLEYGPETLDVEIVPPS